jgi:hypothetical protein
MLLGMGALAELGGVLLVLLLARGSDGWDPQLLAAGVVLGLFGAGISIVGALHLSRQRGGR